MKLSWRGKDLSNPIAPLEPASQLRVDYQTSDEWGDRAMLIGWCRGPSPYAVGDVYRGDGLIGRWVVTSVFLQPVDHDYSKLGLDVERRAPARK